MSIIVLPSLPAPNGAQPFLRDFGGTLTPFLGGPEQRINRIGMRLGIRVTMPPMETDNGRIFVSRLLQARQDRLRMEWPLLSFDPGATGSPLIATAVTGGTAIAIKGLAASYAAREGQFFSLVHGGRRYMHFFAGDVTASAGGTVTAAIWPPLRTNVSVNDPLELSQPLIEGMVSPGDEISWDMSLAHHVSFGFTLVESA